MRDRLKLGAAITVLGLLGMTSVAVAQAPADACGNRKMTKKLEKPLAAAQTARLAKDWQEMLNKAAEAEAVPVEKSAYDLFWIHEFRGIANANLKQYGESIKDLDSGLNSPCMEEADKAGRLKLLVQLSYQNKEYPKAIDYGKRSLAANADDTDVGIYLANAYYITNDFENTRKVIGDVVTKLESTGKRPDEQTYRILQSACVNLKDNNCVVEQMEKLVAYYPKPSYWQDLTNSLMRVSSNDRELLNILRLADGVDVMKEGAMFTEMAQLALAQGLPGEAQAILEKGFSKGVLTEAREKALGTRLLDESKKAVTLDKSTLASQDASAKAKPKGDSDVKLGAAYLSYGELDKAIETLKRGIAKGGVKNPDEAAMLLGIAYVRANKKTEAAEAFRTVTADPAMARIAKLWLLNTSVPAA